MERLQEYQKALEGKSSLEIIQWAVATFGAEKLTMASSLGAEDQVLTHMVASLAVKPRVFTLDTGRVFEETYKCLTASQKAVVALDLLPLLEKEAKQRQRRSNEYRGNGQSAKKCANRNGKGKAAEAAARIVGTNPRYVEMVKSLKRRAPKLVEEVRTGKLTVTVANRLADNEVRKNGKKRRRIRANGDASSRVICGDCLKLILDGFITLFHGKWYLGNVVIKVKVKFSLGEWRVTDSTGNDIEMCTRVW